MNLTRRKMCDHACFVTATSPHWLSKTWKPPGCTSTGEGVSSQPTSTPSTTRLSSGNLSGWRRGTRSSSASVSQYFHPKTDSPAWITTGTHHSSQNLSQLFLGLELLVRSVPAEPRIDNLWKLVPMGSQPFPFIFEKEIFSWSLIWSSLDFLIWSR